MTPNFDHAEEIYLSAKSRALWMTIVAGVSLLIAAVAVLTLLVMMPLKSTTPYLFMVNEETGATQRLAEVQPMDISEQMAVVQANVVRYVIDRETYDTFDNDTRVRSILNLSEGNAAQTLRAIWANPNENATHPDKVYGETVRIKTTVTGVTMLSDAIAQVFITRTRLQAGQPPIESRGIATVGFFFDPAGVKSVAQIWENPLGFRVKDYRLDAQAGE